MAKPYSKEKEQTAINVMKKMGELQTWVFKKSGGRLFKSFFFMAPVGILTHQGRKSGQWRELPLVYMRDKDRIIIVGSRAGCSTHAQWYLNLKANPKCKFQHGRNPVNMIATEASDTERNALWPRLLKVYKGFDDYQSMAQASGRVIPVMILSHDIDGE